LCEPHREFIQAQLRLKRNAMAIFQDLVDARGFAGQYNSVKRFVGKLRLVQPEQFDRLSFLPGEEMQVDYGQGALTRVPGGDKQLQARGRTSPRSCSPTQSRPPSKGSRRLLPP
jgi:hypothetical protein